MIKKAFVFDLDGVIINSENWWEKTHQAGHSLGQSIDASYQAAKKADSRLTWKGYFSKLNAQAETIYRQAPITPNIDDLINKLITDHFRLAVVSGSTQKWIGYTLERLKQPIKTVISVHDRKDLKVKPAPDGYLEAMKLLQVKPEKTIILEDSNLGIKAGKAAGAFVICLTELHPKNYHPQGADLYVKNLKELLTQLDSIQI